MSIPLTKCHIVWKGRTRLLIVFILPPCVSFLLMRNVFFPQIKLWQEKNWNDWKTIRSLLHVCSVNSAPQATCLFVSFFVGAFSFRDIKHVFIYSQRFSTVFLCERLFYQCIQKCVCVRAFWSRLKQLCVCVSPVGADCSASWSSRSSESPLGDFLGFLSGSEGWPPHGSLLNPGERTASHVHTAEGWLMAKWPSRWTSTAPTPRRPSHTTTSTRAASNLHMSTCKCLHTHTVDHLPWERKSEWIMFYFSICLFTIFNGKM